MSINIFPEPTQNVSFNSVSQPVNVTNVPSITVLPQTLIPKSTGRIALNDDRNPKLLHTTTAGQSLVIHSISISQYYTGGNSGDRLGLSVYHHSDAVSTQQTKVITSNFNEKGTTTISFPNGGLKLASGQNLYYFCDNYASAFTLNGRIDIVYSEVTP